MGKMTLYLDGEYVGKKIYWEIGIEGLVKGIKKTIKKRVDGE